MTVRLSVLLPVYNAGEYLDEQVASILQQSDEDFELLCLDDGSSDGSAEKLGVWAARDRRVQLLSGSGNLGQRTRLRQLLSDARGTFVAFADQDDRWASDRNARLLATIGERPVAFGRSQLIDAAGQRIGPTLLDTLGITPDPRLALSGLFRPLVSAHAAIMRREWIDPAVFGHPLPFDWLLGAAALQGGGIAYDDGAVVEHRLHGGNQMNRAAPDQTRHLAALRNRFAFLLRRPAQLRLWLMLDFLGQSAMVDADRRPRFAALAAACRRTWYGAPRPTIEDGALRRALIDELAPLAGSADDLAFATRRIGLVTRSLAHPAKLAAAIRRTATPLAAEF